MSTVDLPEVELSNLLAEMDPEELQEWLDSLEDVLMRYDGDAVRTLLTELRNRAGRRGVQLPFSATTPYVNTIPVEDQPEYPGDLELEGRIRRIIRWNAMAMVGKANKRFEGLGGHIATYASSCTLYEVGFNHFFHARTQNHTGDFVYFQGHASPGMYARSFAEGRLDEDHLDSFRREIPRGTGLSSYPHPWLMPDYWQFPTVSMGLGPITAIYHARFLKYLANRGLIDTSRSHVWCFVGDGEVDEPETLGAITLASREKLDNLIFVVNCNLQRLDGPVRGNGQIVQELEGAFRGAGWNAIKVLWGSNWDPLFERDHTGELVRALGSVVDGTMQRFSSPKVSGEEVRQEFFSTPELQELVSHLDDQEIKRLQRGGHDPEKVYAAFDAAVRNEGTPTVILAHTVKGFALGPSMQAANTTHQQKKLKDDELIAFRNRCAVPLNDEEASGYTYYRPDESTPEAKYMMGRREDLGGSFPARVPTEERLEIAPLDAFSKFLAGSDGAAVSTTMAFAQFIAQLLRDKNVGKRVVPIIPDEARTFGMEALFRQAGIYAPFGQLYEPVDADQLLFYKESKDGQVLEEGINEAGAMSSFIAAGTAYSNVGLNMVPFYIYYSMFGFQRVGDLIWCAGDSRVKGFLVGGTSGRTTLNGEGLQHEDGQSQLIATTVPNLKSYDPAYAYELITIIQDGLRRMYGEGEEIFYYLSVYNDNFPMPPMPEGDEVREGIVRGMYKVRSLKATGKSRKRPQLFGSGPILNCAMQAAEMINEKYGYGCDVWSVTSYSELAREAAEVTRQNKLHPTAEPAVSWLEQQLSGVAGPFIAVSDNVRLVADQIREWVPGQYVALGTDGYGRSDTREALRRHFEIDAECTAYFALEALAREGHFEKERLPDVLKDLEIDPEKVNPLTA